MNPEELHVCKFTIQMHCKLWIIGWSLFLKSILEFLCTLHYNVQWFCVFLSVKNLFISEQTAQLSKQKYGKFQDHDNCQVRFIHSYVITVITPQKYFYLPEKCSFVFYMITGQFFLHCDNNFMSYIYQWQKNLSS